MNWEIMNRGPGGKVLVCLCLTMLLLGLSRGAAHAQTKLVPNGGTITITKGGSYFLATNVSSSLVNAPLILVKATNVTINLNGFVLFSSATTGSNGSGIKVAAGFSNLTVVNGTITKIRGNAIVVSSNSTVSGVQLTSNSGDGVDCTSACLVTNNIVSGNGGTGLKFSDATSGYQNNIISGNGATVAGGTNMGHNVCNSSLTCP
jgi:hypothetical protein